MVHPSALCPPVPLNLHLMQETLAGMTCSLPHKGQVKPLKDERRGPNSHRGSRGESWRGTGRERCHGHSFSHLLDLNPPSPQTTHPNSFHRGRCYDRRQGCVGTTEFRAFGHLLCVGEGCFAQPVNPSPMPHGGDILKRLHCWDQYFRDQYSACYWAVRVCERVCACGCTCTPVGASRHIETAECICVLVPALVLYRALPGGDPTRPQTQNPDP